MISFLCFNKFKTLVKTSFPLYSATDRQKIRVTGKMLNLLKLLAISQNLSGTLYSSHLLSV